MYKIFTLISIVFIIISGCDKNPGHLVLAKTIPGGCALNTEKGINTVDTGGVKCSFENGYLNIRVDFWGGCCEPYSNSYNIKADTLFINIDSDVNNGYCNCLCMYSYTFLFKGPWTNYYYNIFIDRFSRYTGKINL